MIIHNAPTYDPQEVKKRVADEYHVYEQNQEEYIKDVLSSGLSHRLFRISCAVLSGIMGFYLASSRLMYSMSRDGYLPEWFGRVDSRYGTPKNAMIFCIIVSLSGPILGREALGWFVDMSAIGASIGYFFTSASTLVIARRDGDGTKFLMVMALTGVIFSVIFMILQLIPIPGLSGVHFGKESYIMLIVWIAIGLVFYFNYFKQRRFFSSAE